MTLEFWRAKLHYPVTPHYRCPRCGGPYSISLTNGRYRETLVHCDACKYEYKEFVPTLLIDASMLLVASVVMRLFIYLLPSQWDILAAAVFFLLFVLVVIIAIFAMDQARYALMSSAAYQGLINKRIAKGRFKTKY